MRDEKETCPSMAFYAWGLQTLQGDEGGVSMDDMTHLNQFNKQELEPCHNELNEIPPNGDNRDYEDPGEADLDGILIWGLGLI